jgi:hypothetical protein
VDAGAEERWETIKPPRSADGDMDERGSEAAVDVDRVLAALYGDSEKTDASEHAAMSPLGQPNHARRDRQVPQDVHSHERHSGGGCSLVPLRRPPAARKW